MDDIRKNIEQTPALQHAADKLLQDLAKRIPAKQGEEILSAILDKVREGLNLAEQYPKFEQMLSGDPDLLLAFQEMIELLKQESSEPAGYNPQKSWRPSF